MDRIVGLLALVPFVIGSLVGPSGPSSTVDLTFQDPAIVESSGLVVRDGLYLTTNDSGDSGRVFVVDGSGETVGSTTWASNPRDVESLAPADPGFVWVGDTGDNSEARDSIKVLRVPYGREFQEVEPTTYTLVYPDGPHDAETLLAQPQTGQLFVVTKNIFGGTVYAAPREMSESKPNKLRPVADSLGFATDGSFYPDGRHYVLRDYLSASVYTFPGHDKIGSFTLPRQRQGEGISVDEDDGIHVSTEGQFTDVRSVKVPRSVVAAMEPSSPPSPAVSPSSDLEVTVDEPGDDEPMWPWLLGGAALAGFVVIGGWLLIRHGAAS